MAFDIQYMGRVNTSANGQALRAWSYNATSSGGNETLATISASGFFNDFQQSVVSGDEFGPLQVGDILFLNGNDGSGIYQIDSISTNVTVAAYTSSAATASHVVKFAGQETTAGGSASESFTVTGALATDLAFVQVVNDGTNNVTVLQADVSADSLDVTFSGDPSSDTVINYQILRAV